MSGREHAHDGERCQHASAETRRRPWWRSVVLAPILFYRWGISPNIGPHCRYEPTCSAYAVQAVDRYGILRGLVLASWRVVRCNPWGGSGLDRPEDQRLFPLIARTKRAPES